MSIPLTASITPAAQLTQYRLINPVLDVVAVAFQYPDGRVLVSLINGLYPSLGDAMAALESGLDFVEVAR